MSWRIDSVVVCFGVGSLSSTAKLDTTPHARGATSVDSESRSHREARHLDSSDVSWNSRSQEDLAAKSEIHRTYIGDIERGARNVALRNIEKLAASLELSVSQLFVLYRIGDSAEQSVG